MTIIASTALMSETIAEITNLKILEVYRKTASTAFGYAKVMDDHLNDLGERIVKAMEEHATQPAPDEYETWLLEKQKADQLQGEEQTATDVEEVETKPVIEPDPEEHNREASTGPDAEPMTQQSQEPIGGGILDTSKESNESPTTDQVNHKAPEPTGRENKESETAISGAGSDITPQDGLQYLKALVEAWKANLDCSNVKLAELAGVSDPTIGQILHGRKVSSETRDKVLAAIEKHESLTGVMAVPEKLNGSADKKKAKRIERDMQNGGGQNDAGSFIQLQLITWMRLEHLGIKEASGRLMVQESALRSIHKGELPHPNIVRQLARYIPAIEGQQSVLMHAAEQKEAA